ncbi:hypothetical protein TruAng_004996 [Truncatella angustata]|nr:hypothetical protein TruAng_004996 [Truncatella angustata]
MENWLRENAKPALLEALDEALHRVENDYQNAYHAENIKVAELNGQIQVLKVQAAKVGWLEQQNKNLKDELGQLKTSNHKQHQNERQSSVASRTEVRTPLGPLSANRARSLGASVKHGDHLDTESLNRDELIAEYNKLNGKYGKLRGQFSDVLGANELLKKQLRDKIQACEKWVEHSKVLEVQSNSRKQKIEKLRARLNAVTQDDATVDASFVSESHLITGDGPLQTEDLPAQNERNATDVITSWPPLLRDASRDSSVLDGTDETGRAPSLPPLPTVWAAATYHNAIKEPSSDSPVIVSERAVRKRRRDDAPAQAPAATRIKREEEGSDPIMTSEQRRFIVHESSFDFDNAGARIVTPRKTRTTRSASREAPETVVRGRSHSHGRSSSSARDSSPSAFAAHGSMSAHVQERDRAAAQWRETIQDNEYTEAMDYGEPADELHANIQGDQAAVPWRRNIQADKCTEAMECGTPNDRSSALEPTIATTPKLIAREPKFNAVVPVPLREGIESLAEDGNSIMPTPTSAGRHTTKAGRLADLLNNTATLEREAIIRPSTRSAKKTSTRHDHVFKLPEKRVLPWQQAENTVGEALRAPSTPAASNAKRTVSAIKPKKTPLNATEKTKSKKDVPLRRRPAWSLKRADFKINPKCNDGLDFAYADVVRGKDRALLPGCSREECCGKLYRPLAEHDLGNTSYIAFTSFLEHYLGEDAGRLGSMGKEEKEKIWLDAKIKEYSQKHGRHRERYSAMQEPPGWTDIGMPSTQEELEYREAAKRIESEEIAFRRSEALKKGRYLFMDEDP